jgi:uncharacterized protein (TIGR03067 family)
MRSVLAVVWFAAVATAAEPTKDLAKEAADRLRGAWRTEGPEVLRAAQEELNFGNLEFTFREDRCEFSTPDPQDPKDIPPALATATIRLDPSATPARMDLAFEWNKTERKKLAIYKVEGDTLTICWGQTRPTKFKCDDRDGGGSYLAVFKRVKR